MFGNLNVLFTLVCWSSSITILRLKTMSSFMPPGIVLVVIFILFHRPSSSNSHGEYNCTIFNKLNTCLLGYMPNLGYVLVYLRIYYPSSCSMHDFIQ